MCILSLRPPWFSVWLIVGPALWSNTDPPVPPFWVMWSVKKAWASEQDIEIWLGQELALGP